MIDINKIYNGTCLDVLKTLPDNSIDSCVTDPPYGISFMNKHWDYDVPKVEVWKEVLRVLKPGGHILCACGTRTQHRMAVNIEDAGFEIRDIITWHYGQGFPKSLNVNKQLENEICNCKKEISREQEAEYDMRPMQQSDISKEVGTGKTSREVLQQGLSEQSPQGAMLWQESSERVSNGKESRMEGRYNDVQEERQLQEHKIHSGRGLDKADGKKGRVHNGTQVSDGETLSEAINKDGSGTSCRPRPNEQQPEELGTISEQCNTQINGAWETCSGCSKPILPDGIGTAIKPATELWTLARKPIECKTVAENVLKYGTGGINIDGSRIAHNEEQKFANRKERSAGWNMDNCGFDSENNSTASANEKGRFPANVIFDEFMGAELDKQTGVLTSGHMDTVSQGKNYGIYGKYNGKEVYAEGDSGGASRFFYCPKADNYERNKGLKGFEVKQAVGGGGGIGDYLDDVNSASGKYGSEKAPKRNHHPTVKPIDLMRYLVKLITPKRGICLDPYCGSGTTLIGCKMELINYIGIEREEEYCKIAEARVAAWNPERFIEQKLF